VFAINLNIHFLTVHHAISSTPDADEK